MSKIFNKVILFIFTILIVPASCFFVGCGATPVNQAQGVSFLSNMQNEKGQAVFELDLKSPLKLPYKINPSSAYGYAPRFTAISGISGDNMETYSLDIVTGEFCIKRADFKDVEVEITVGSFTDVCLITMKEYPSQIGIYDETQFNSLNIAPKINLACGSSYQINIAGIMEDSEIIDAATGEKRPSLLHDSEYNFLVEVDKDSRTLINVPNSNRLNFVAYNNYGKAKVKVALCDYFGNVFVDDDGNSLYAFEIEINVYKPCSYMDVKLSGVNTLISSKNTRLEYNMRMNEVEQDLTNNRYIINFEAYFYDEYDRFIDDENLEIKCFIDKKTYITIDNDQKIIYLNTPPSGAAFKVKVEVWSNAPMISGEFCMTSFDLIINF